MSQRTKQRMDVRLFTLVAALGAAGCGTNAATTATSCADNPPGCICTGDDSCGGANPRCDTHTGRCMPCLPESNDCGAGLRCVRDGTNYRCAASCLAATDCGAGEQCCGGSCVDTSRSDGNCGACGAACAALPNAHNSCVGGGCVITACDPGFGDCDGNSRNGCETQTTTDVRNCGGCGTSCPAGANATPSCAAGACKVTCVQGFADCDGATVNGCEVDVSGDSVNCGACGNHCGALPNALTTACVTGQCIPAACNGWFGDCNRNPADGCEADTQTDINNCGGCGVVCPVPPNGEAACQRGTCVIAHCNDGYGDCDTDPVNGCELPTFLDPDNCGACGNRCLGANGAQECRDGACAVALCNVGFADCDRRADNGCEVNVLSEVRNCGACGNSCPAAAHAEAVCVLGVCKPGACKPGFADCNQDPADGCEVDITTIDNCGACGVTCAVPANGTPRCLAGRCTIGACNGGFASCDGNDGNGCESDLARDANACGACGISCSYSHAAGICAAGKCAMGACDAGRADCNHDDKDGCELPVDADPANCGGCGVVCPNDNPYCVKGRCTASTHAVEQLSWDYQTPAEGCGNYSIWYSQDLGAMTWDDCEAAANKYGAMMMGQSGWFGSYSAPYQYDDRWVGEADADNGWVGNSGWDSLSMDSKGASHKCVLAYANGTEHGADTLPNSITSLNGKQYLYDDLGVVGESDCYNKAREAGARPLNPWMFNGVTQDTSFLVESHICHGSTLYQGLGGYSSDGEENHYYRCFIGYNP